VKIPLFLRLKQGFCLGTRDRMVFCAWFNLSSIGLACPR
jgi:hypothetical protein